MMLRFPLSFLLSLALLVPNLALARAIIDNGTIQMGIDDLGQLNVPGGTPSRPSSSTTTVGLRFIPTNGEATAPGCLCEGWGAADAATGVTGFANNANGIAGLTLVSFSTAGAGTRAESVGREATSVVEVGTTFRVTHHYFPSPDTPFLYQVDVTIENISGSDVTDLRYRRVMDWDIPPTTFDEFVTIQGTTDATNVILATDDGFESANPLSGNTPIIPSSIGDFVDSGPTDHGACFDFGFGALPAGATRTFSILYGAAGNEQDALAALVAANAEIYSFGQANVGGPAENDNTFIFAFKGVGGKGLGATDLDTTIEGIPVDIPGFRRAWSAFDSSVGYYDAAAGEGVPSQLPPIEETLRTPILVSDPATLAGVQVLFLQNPNPAGYGQEFLDSLAAIETAVREGAVLLMHDRNPAGAPAILPDFDPSVPFTAAPGVDIHVETSNTLITNGPLGKLDNGSLDRISALKAILPKAAGPLAPIGTSASFTYDAAAAGPDGAAVTLSNLPKLSTEQYGLWLFTPDANADGATTANDTCWFSLARNDPAAFLAASTQNAGATGTFTLELAAAHGVDLDAVVPAVTCDKAGAGAAAGLGLGTNSQLRLVVTKGDQTDKNIANHTIILWSEPIDTTAPGSINTAMTFGSAKVDAEFNLTDVTPFVPSHYGYADRNALLLKVPGAVPLLSNGNPNQLVMFAYPHEDGWVVYSTIPLDAFLAAAADPVTPTPSAFAQTYAPNAIAYATALAEGLVITEFTQPQNGTLILNADGTFTYTPAPGFTGRDSYTVTVLDRNDIAATVTVNVTVLPLPSKVVALIVPQDTLTPGQAKGDGDFFATRRAPFFGKVAWSNPATGAFFYTPDKGFTGTDMFTYDVFEDGHLVGKGRVVMVIEPADNAAPDASGGSCSDPAPGRPVGTPLALATDKGVPVEGTLAATGGCQLIYRIETNGTLGQAEILDPLAGRVRYTPKDALVEGTDTFKFTATYGDRASDPVPVTVRIAGKVVDDSPASPGDSGTPATGTSQPISSGGGGGGGCFIDSLSF